MFAPPRCFGVVAAWLACAAQVPAAWAQESTQPTAREGWAVFPAMGYTPRTSVFVGGAVVRSFTTDTSARASSVRLLGLYTLTHQYAAQLIPDVFVQGERWHLWGEVAARRRPDTLYPPGNQSTKAEAEAYTTDDFGVRVGPSVAIAGPFRVGLHMGVAISRVHDKTPDGLLDAGTLEGSGGATLIGLGPIFILDDRDDNLSPSRGRHYRLQSEHYRKALGSATDTGIHFLDLRHYATLTEGWVLAGQIHLKTVTGAAPFQVMSELGGDQRMRGFVGGRYRDRSMLFGQVELRFPLLDDINGAAFIGSGHVAEGLSKLSPMDLKYAGGAGLRYRFSDNNGMVLRFDAAASEDGDFNLYVTFGQAF